MEDYCAVNIKYISIDQGNLINNLIQSKQLTYNVNKKKGVYSVDFLINNFDLDLDELIYNKLYETFCIITEEDYKSLIGLLYNDSKELINYNDKYFIIEIQAHFKFKGNQHTVNSVRKTFLQKFQKNSTL